MEVDLSKAAAAQEGGESISLSLFALINQARNEHGMRQQDFKRYRQFCSVKVHRLREGLNKTHTDKIPHQEKNKKNQKVINKKQLSRKQKLKAQSAAVQSASSKGKGHVFVKKTISIEEVQNDRPAQLFLFEAERAWSHSQELKQEAFEKNQDGAIRKHGLSRLSRGVKWAKCLLDLITALGAKRVDIMSRAEVAAYHTLLRGYESFDKNNFQSCIEQLSVTRKLLYAIADACNDSRKEALANSYVDSTEAMMRFCGYNLDNGEQDMDVLAKEGATPEVCEKVTPGLQKLILELQESKKGGEKVKRLDHVTWHDQTIPIRNPELVDVILHVDTAEARLRKSLTEKSSGASILEKGGKTQVRQRLTSAQRSAKKRGAGTASASKVGAASTSTNAPKTEMDGYDGILAALTDAESTARKLVQDNAEALAKSHSSRYEAASGDLIRAHEYLLYKLLSIQVERNTKLIEEVNEKGSKRQKKVHDYASKKLQDLSSPPKTKTRKEESTPMKRKALIEKKKKVRTAGSTKKRQSQSRTISSPAVDKRGNSKKLSVKKKKQEERLQKQAVLKAQRITVRSVPGVAKLLDSCEMSCSGISTLGLVENEANVLTLIEAKSAWYKGELLRTLARSYAWNSEHDKSLLLLNRAELFVREARSAMELVEEEEVEKENEEVQPVINDTSLATIEAAINEFRRNVQRDVFIRQHSQSKKINKVTLRTSAAQSKANVAINEMAIKYVTFDPIDLKDALRLSSEREAELWAEVHGAKEVPDEMMEEDHWQDADQVKSEPPRTREISMATTTVSDDFDDELVGKSNDTGGAYDPANLIEDEDEEDSAEAKRKAGWLGGWFGRK